MFTNMTMYSSYFNNILGSKGKVEVIIFLASVTKKNQTKRQFLRLTYGARGVVKISVGTFSFPHKELHERIAGQI